MRSKEHYQLEVQLGINAALLKAIVSASFSCLPQKPRSAGYPAIWSVDMRVPLSRSVLLRPVAKEIAGVLGELDISQIAGSGFGASFLIGGVLAVAHEFNGGLVRQSKKSYGLGKHVEGGLDRKRPVFLIDDVLSSGSSALQAAATLSREGFLPVGILTILRYGWRGGHHRLQEAGLISKSLATLYPLKE